ncbi:MAG: fibrobacter succinogenes major paralogous domain-containing protein [Fibromonadaceae bacterium]|nr:fibrobacter succinogenes major paralogous domain-containing protein [Fibromonadaceae bacterium]
MNKQTTRKGVACYAPAIAAGLALAITLTFTACEAASGKPALVGKWGLVVGPAKDNPEDMELLGDGTGIVDKGGITWKVEKDRFYMTHPLMAKSWSYKLQGSTLMLTDDNGKVAKLSKKEKCGDKWYYLATQSCKGNEIANDGCNGKVYSLKTEYCSSDGTVKKYGTITMHGSQAYKTVKIGTQTWMAENLNYNAEGSKCYNNEPSNCEKYGRLYNWETAKKVCPSGWHLPSNEEWDKLYRLVDGTSGTESPYKSETAGNYLKATEGWKDNKGESGNGLDVGFSALPGGYGGSGGYFSLAGDYGSWWSASEYSGSYAYIRDMYYVNEGANWVYNDKSVLYSVRCVQD